VVNKMLRDLDSQAKERAEPDNLSAGSHYQPPQRSHHISLILILLLVVVATGAAGYFWWHFSSVQPTSNPGIIPLNQQVLVNTSEPQQRASDTPVRTQAPADMPAHHKVNTSSELPVIDAPVSEPAAMTAAMTQEPQPAVVTSEPARMPATKTEPAADKTEPASARATAGQLSVTRNTPVLSTADSLRMQIGAALEHNDQSQAIQLLRELVILENNNPQPAKKLASVYYAQGQVIKAQAILDKQIRLHPAEPSLRLMSARLLVKQNEPNQALQRLYDLPASAAPGTDYMSFRAALAQEQGLLEQAMSDYHLLVAQDSQNARWWLGLGIVADKQNQAGVARAAYQQALSLKQLAPSVHQYISSRLTSLQELHNG